MLDYAYILTTDQQTPVLGFCMCPEEFLFDAALLSDINHSVNQFMQGLQCCMHQSRIAAHTSCMLHRA